MRVNDELSSRKRVASAVVGFRRLHIWITSAWIKRLATDQIADTANLTPRFRCLPVQELDSLIASSRQCRVPDTARDHAGT